MNVEPKLNMAVIYNIIYNMFSHNCMNCKHLLMTGPNQDTDLDFVERCKVGYHE